LVKYFFVVLVLLLAGVSALMTLQPISVSVSGGGGGNSSGTVTDITAGTGLSGGTITTSGTIQIDPTYTQRRVSSTCAVGSSIRVINENGTVECQTDTSGGGGSSYNPPLYLKEYDFEHNVAGYTTLWTPTAIGSGTNNLVDGFSGNISMSAGSNRVNSGYSFQTPGTGFYRVLPDWSTTAYITPLCRTNGQNLSVIKFGFQDIFTGIGDSVDGAYFNITINGTLMNISTITASNSVLTINSTTNLYNCSQPYTLEVYVNNSGIVHFWAKNTTSQQVLFQTIHSTNIPTTAGRTVGHGLNGVIVGNSSTTNLILMYADYMNIKQNGTRVQGR
jgi:hypothetical protein